jgi:DHA1 family bicyclomycin/chloramphenicol resistance-like MFS transporter
MLGLASGLSPFGMAVIVPSMATFARVFDTSEGMAALLISGYLLGLTLAQPLHGVLADRFGRRPVLIGGFALFTVASLACAFAPTLGWLVAGRFVQALGVSVGTVASRAVIRDTRDTAGTAEGLAYITAFMGVAPVIAPMVGGTLDVAYGWRSVFLASAALGVLILAWVVARLPETLRFDPNARMTLAGTVSNYGVLLRSREFVGFTCLYGFSGGVFFAFLTVGAAIFERDLGLDQRAFGLIWGAMSITYVAGAAFGGVLTRSRGIGGTLRLGVGITALVGATMPLLALGAGVGVWTLLLPLAVLMTCSGFIGPQSLAGAVSIRPDIAGTASGLSSSLGLLLSAVFAVLSGFVYTGDAMSTYWLIAVATTLTALSLAFSGYFRPGTEPASEPEERLR